MSILRRRLFSEPVKVSNMATAPSKYITLISGDDYEFVVLREAAMISPFIKRSLDPKSQFLEAKSGRCIFPEMRQVTYPSLQALPPLPPAERMTVTCKALIDRSAQFCGVVWLKPLKNYT